MKAIATTIPNVKKSTSLVITEPTLSVIVPVYNNPEMLRKCLASIYNSDYKNYEVIVVDSASPNKAVLDVAKEFGCRLIRLEEDDGVANARNIGADNARGDILVFFDPDIILEKNTLIKFAEAHKNPQVKIVQCQVGNKSLKPGFAADIIAVIWEHQLNEMHPNPSFVSTMAFSIDREVFKEIGKFNIQLGIGEGGGGEEFEFGTIVKQHNYIIYQDNSFKVHHHFQDFWPRFKTLYKRSYVYSRLLLNKEINLNKGNGTKNQGINSLLSVSLLPIIALSFLFPASLIGIPAILLGQIAIESRMYEHILKIRGPKFFLTSIPLIHLWYLALGFGVTKAVTDHYTKQTISALTWGSFFISETPSYVIFYVNAVCNARCKHCFINWDDTEKLSKKALTLEEIKKISKSFGKVKYMSLTGGEPTLRADLAEIAREFYNNNKLEILNLITNGFGPRKIIKDVKKILRYCPKMHIQVHFSIDGIGKQHDEIRVVEGGFNKLLESVEQVRALQKHYPNLHVGIITTYSKFNKHNIYEIIDYVTLKMKLPLYMNYVRGTTYDKTAKDIDLKTFKEASKVVAIRNTQLQKNKFPRPIDAMNHLAPQLITKLEETNEWQTPCRVGSKMIEIGHDGTIFPCEILNVNFGLIQDFNYDIRKILSQDKVKKFVKDIVDEKCKCTWECALKNNMLYDPSKYPLLAKEYVKLLIKKT
ncbi:MAG: glycosyltransferase [Nanoarchaeota archaeon]